MGVLVVDDDLEDDDVGDDHRDHVGSLCPRLTIREVGHGAGSCSHPLDPYGVRRQADSQTAPPGGPDDREAL
jgi:hypothetical protein